MKDSSPLVYLPVLADVVASVAVWRLLSALVRQMQTRSTINVILISVAFVLFCIAVTLIRKLEPLPATNGASQVPAVLLTPFTMRVLAVLFGAAVMFAIMDQFRYWDLILVVDDRVLGAGESSAFFVYGPGAWLGASLLYILVLSAAVRPTIQRQAPSYTWLALLGLLGVNGMLLLGTAVLRSLVIRWRPEVSPVWGIPGFVVLLLLFAPPRLWFVSKWPSVIPLISFAILLAYCAWQIIA